MHPLDGPRQKVEHARAHIERLRPIHSEFLRSASHRLIVAELQPGGRYYALRVLADVTPPPNLGLCIGDVAHQLRSALDGLVYQLALAQDADTVALRRTAFPIFHRFRVKGCRQRLEGTGTPCRGGVRHYLCGRGQTMAPLSRRHKAMIERMQPYHRRNGGTRDPLFLLSELNNSDKHRLLPVAGAKVGAYGAGYGDEPIPVYQVRPRTIFEDGAKVGWVEAWGVHAQRVLEDQPVVALLSFGHGCDAVRGLGVVATLDRMADRVSEILEAFEDEF